MRKIMPQQKPSLTIRQQEIIRRIQVNIPFPMLFENDWLDLFLGLGLNPEFGMDAQALDNFGKDEYIRIAGLFKERGRSITLHAPFLDLSPGSPDPKIREATRYRFTQLVETIPIFQPVSIVCHAGYEEDRYSFCKEIWMQYCIETLHWLGKETHQRGSRLMVENVYEIDPNDFLAVISHLDPTHTRCCLDVGHLTAFGKSSLQPWTEAVGAYVGQLHLHDNTGERDSHMGMGQGRIDFKAVFDFIRSLKIPPILTLEPHTQDAFLESLNFLEQNGF